VLTPFKHKIAVGSMVVRPKIGKNTITSRIFLWKVFICILRVRFWMLEILYLLENLHECPRLYVQNNFVLQICRNISCYFWVLVELSWLLLLIRTLWAWVYYMQNLMLLYWQSKMGWTEHINFYNNLIIVLFINIFLLFT
jgi:hypothetical protein